MGIAAYSVLFPAGFRCLPPSSACCVGSEPCGGCGGDRIRSRIARLLDPSRLGHLTDGSTHSTRYHQPQRHQSQRHLYQYDGHDLHAWASMQRRRDSCQS